MRVKNWKIQNNEKKNCDKFGILNLSKGKKPIFLRFTSLHVTSSSFVLFYPQMDLTLSSLPNLHSFLAHFLPHTNFWYSDGEICPISLILYKIVLFVF
jgi:hypothetical protein